MAHTMKWPCVLHFSPLQQYKIIINASSLICNHELTHCKILRRGVACNCPWFLVVGFLFAYDSLVFCYSPYIAIFTPWRTPQQCSRDHAQSKQELKKLSLAQRSKKSPLAICTIHTGCIFCFYIVFFVNF